MQILRASEHRRMPWKNGGGETVEIAVFPPGASVNDFDWRISMATVATDGPFSVFPEIDRTLSILDGDGMSLTIDDAAPLLLTKSSEPLHFAADVPLNARLMDGAITDLNVMTRRGRFSHCVERLTGSARISPDTKNEVVFLLATRSMSIDSNKGRIALEPLDAAFIETATDVTGENIVSYVIRITPA